MKQIKLDYRTYIILLHKFCNFDARIKLLQYYKATADNMTDVFDAVSLNLWRRYYGKYNN